MRIGRRVVLASVLALGFVSSTKADVIMDQIGPNPSFVNGQNGFSSQDFGASFPTFKVGVVDDFVISGGTKNLTEVDAALVGFGGATAATYTHVTAWGVNIYSSLAASNANLTGDVASFAVAPGAVTLTNPYGVDPNGFFPGLVQIPISKSLTNGTYFVSVIPVLDFSVAGEQLGVYASTFAGTPGGSNAFQENPGGGFGVAGNQTALNINAAYRIIGTPLAVVPEPSVMVLASAGLAGVFFVRRWKSRKAIV